MKSTSRLAIFGIISVGILGFTGHGFTGSAPFGKSVCQTEGNRDLIVQSLSSSQNDGNQPKAFQEWYQDTRIDVRNFLTQRSIQSFMYLCEECRDPHSGKWIEDFFETQNLLNYHGTGVSFTTDGSWDSPLLSMLEQPEDVLIVSAKRRGRGHGGWSKNNPYLQDRYVEFKIHIEPISLTDRILAVREQLATEWVTDLAILKTANQEILDSYFKLAKDDRQALGSSSSEAFERTAVNALNVHTAFGASGSPFRKGSFDLLYNLCTQASIHRVLQSLREKGETNNLDLLLNFYVDRLDEFFDGDLPFGRADDFIEELLLSSPSVIHGGDGSVALTDPFGLSERIIEARNDVFTEWIEAMSQVPTAHQDGVRKALLNKRMEAWNSYSGGKNQQQQQSDSSSNNGGEFQ